MKFLGREFNFFVLILAVFVCSEVFSAETGEEKEQSVFMDFRNQKTADILYSLSKICGKSLIVDDTVTGSSTFHFKDKNFDAALERFCESNSLYVEKKEDIYYVSKVFLETAPDGKSVTVNAEETDASCFLRLLSRRTAKTIMFEKLPEAFVTIRQKGSSVEDILNLVLLKLPGFGLERIGDGYFISKQTGSSSRRNVDVFNLSRNEEKYTLSLEKAELGGFLDSFFKKAGFEYSLLFKNRIEIEKLYFKEKSFEELLKLVLQQAGCSFLIQENIYFVFEGAKKDSLREFKSVKLVHLKNISTELLNKLMPSEVTGSVVIKSDEKRNLLVLAGTENEIKVVEAFIEKVDVESLCRLENKNVRSVKLKFIKSDELMSSLPSTLNKSEITKTFDTSLIFYSGSEESFKEFLRELEALDKPRQQIKYQILVVQRQKTEGEKLNSTFTAEDTDEKSGISRGLTLSNIFNVNFDIISQLGLSFAWNFNAELSSGKSRVLADTTLNGISGEAISFSNTNTYRYRDIIVDTTGDLYTSTTREISSGLTLSINGWVSGDDMITVKIDAQVSKQGSSSASGDTSNPPSTSEKKVSTNVRTKSGQSVIIGGLFQQETDISEKRVPFLGKLPLIGNFFKHKTTSQADTEFVIYLVPFVEKKKAAPGENLKRYEEKYGKI